MALPYIIGLRQKTVSDFPTIVAQPAYNTKPVFARGGLYESMRPDFADRMSRDKDGYRDLLRVSTYAPKLPSRETVATWARNGAEVPVWEMTWARCLPDGAVWMMYERFSIRRDGFVSNEELARSETWLRYDEYTFNYPRAQLLAESQWKEAHEQHGQEVEDIYDSTRVGGVNIEHLGGVADDLSGVRRARYRMPKGVLNKGRVVAEYRRKNGGSLYGGDDD